MLALGRALMARPKLLMLDEPSWDWRADRARDLSYDLRTQATRDPILLVEQNARAALQVADFGYVLETGSVALSGPAASLRMMRG